MISLIKKYVTIVSSVVIVTGSMFTNTTAYAASGDTVVYITNTGECYHNGSCKSLKKSKIETTMQKAVDKGLRPCKNCKPGSIDGASASSNTTKTTTAVTNVAKSTSTVVDAVEALKTYKGNSKEFNAYTYYSNYADLQTAVGADGDKLLKHWNEHGKAEGRVAK